MSKYKALAGLALCGLLAAGCTANTGTDSPPPQDTANQAASVPQAAEPPDGQAPLPESEVSAAPAQQSAASSLQLTEGEAQALVRESLDQAYTVAPTDVQLDIADETGTMHGYYVFEVTREDGGYIGQVAVDKQSGDKHTYKGEGILTPYEEFPLYDAYMEGEYDWEGSYRGPSNQTLEILQGDGNSFEYIFSDGTTGNARITGNTARAIEGELSFLYAGGVVTVAGSDTLTGNYW